MITEIQEKILKGTIQVFNKKGLKLTMDDVADEPFFLALFQKLECRSPSGLKALLQFLIDLRVFVLK